MSLSVHMYRCLTMIVITETDKLVLLSLRTLWRNSEKKTK